MSTTAVLSEVRGLLSEQLPAVFAPAERLPVEDGRVAQCAVIWAMAGRERVRADSVARKDRVESFQVTCVGASAFECLAAVEKARSALVGASLASAGAGSGRISDVSAAGLVPTIEPGTDPVRVSLPLSFQVVSKKVGG